MTQPAKAAIIGTAICAFFLLGPVALALWLDAAWPLYILVVVVIVGLAG